MLNAMLVMEYEFINDSAMVLLYSFIFWHDSYFFKRVYFVLSYENVFILGIQYEHTVLMCYCTYHNVMITII